MGSKLKLNGLTLSLWCNKGLGVVGDSCWKSWTMGERYVQLG